MLFSGDSIVSRYQTESFAVEECLGSSQTRLTAFHDFLNGPDPYNIQTGQLTIYRYACKALAVQPNHYCFSCSDSCFVQS